ncbi:hypothetical protein Tco_0702018 [Tanacetum coccineum]|uniref:Uncharacterized protein n=1 Tax=Tanacetum coccineum TaxID=301880 RepID=A0ABQ4XWK1_9ASTR
MKHSKVSPDAGFKPSREEEKKDAKDSENKDSKVNVVDENIVYGCANDPNMPNLEEIVYSDDDEDVGAEADGIFLITHTETDVQEKDKKKAKNLQNRAGMETDRRSQIEAYKLGLKMKHKKIEWLSIIYQSFTQQKTPRKLSWKHKMQVQEEETSDIIEPFESGYHQKDRKPSQNDKTEHGMERDCANEKARVPKMSKSESILKKSAVKPEPTVEILLNGIYLTI